MFSTTPVSTNINQLPVHNDPPAQVTAQTADPTKSQLCIERTTTYLKDADSALSHNNLYVAGKLYSKAAASARQAGVYGAGDAAINLEKLATEGLLDTQLKSRVTRPMPDFSSNQS